MDRGGSGMKIPNSEHESRPWRIREIAQDFILEDVWALPTTGGPEDFETLIQLGTSFDPAKTESRPTRALWSLRDRLGDWLGIGRISVAADDQDKSLLAGRLPDDLRDTADDLHFDSLPFTPLYRTNDEFAAEVSNSTMDGVMHLAWVAQAEGRYQAQMAVYVRPHGLFGKGYMALIKPFRYWIVYPALTREIERAWRGRTSQ
jgi:Protein of unknown function (DUF2867)